MSTYEARVRLEE